MEQKIWKLLVAIFLLMCASVLLLLAYVLNVSILCYPAFALVVIGIFKGVLTIFEHRETENNNIDE